MPRFKCHPESRPAVDTLRLNGDQLTSINQRLEGLTSRVEPDTVPRRVGLFNFLKFEGQYYDRTGGFGSEKRVRVWLGEATNPITGQTKPHNVAVIDKFEDDTSMTLDLDTGSYDYDVSGLHTSRLARYARQQLGPEASSDIELGEGEIYRTFLYGLSDAGSPEAYRDTAAPPQ